MAPPKLTPAQIRDRKAKRLAIGLTVVFLGVVGFQAPRMIKLFHGGKPAAAAPASQGTTSSAAGGQPAATTPAAAAVPGSGAASGSGSATAGVLHNLSAFPAKDPFVAQVSGSSGSGAGGGDAGGGDAGGQGAGGQGAATTSATPSAPTASGGAGAATTTPSQAAAPAAPTVAAPPPTATTTPAQAATSPASTVAAPPAPPTTTTTTTATTTTKAAAAPPPVGFTVTRAPNAAVIAFDGELELVRLGASFPTGAPIFKLVELGGANGTARISVRGGSFTNGDPSLLLEHGKPVVLADSRQGGRYVIELLGLTAEARAPGAGPTSEASSGAASSRTGSSV